MTKNTGVSDTVKALENGTISTTSAISNTEYDNSESLFDYDELKMYFGEDYWVTDKIKISQPSLGQILEFGDSKFYTIVNTLCANTTSFRLKLWDIGIDWTTISDFELFRMLIKNFEPQDTYLLFGDLNFSWFEAYKKNDDSLVLVNIPRDEEGNMIYVEYKDAIIIDEFVYMKIVDYLRHMFDVHPKEEKKVKGKTTKKWMIEEERMNQQIELEKRKKDKRSSTSPLYPLVSALVNHPGFKYKKNELKEVGIVEFMDSVKRLQTYESIKALMSGVYSGMMDTSKMNLSKELNWMKDLYEK